MFSEFAFKIFEESIRKYHIIDDVYQSFVNPYESNTIEHLFYRKNWIDTVQWHYEDIIRDPQIDPVAALDLKRKIDASNQDRTDMVEYIDSYFLDKFKEVSPFDTATINSESPAWAIDACPFQHLRFIICERKAERKDATADHRRKCKEKLDVLLEQRVDLSTAIDQLLEDIKEGRKYMKVYKQMKMYNDNELNPVLRGQK